MSGHFILNDHECKICFIIGLLKIGIYRLQSGHIFMKIYIVMDVVNDITYSHESVNTHVVIILFIT